MCRFAERNCAVPYLANLKPMNKTNRKAKTAQPAPIKARVMWAHIRYNDGTIPCYPEKDGYDRESVAVIPTATAKQAKALADFCNLTEEERVKAITRAIEFSGSAYRIPRARAIYDLIFGGAK